MDNSRILSNNVPASSVPASSYGEAPSQDEIAKENYSEFPFVVIASFREPHLANLAKSQIESAGIPVSLRDEHIVTMQWLYSNAVGGVKLAVPADRVEEALALLQSDHEKETIQAVADQEGAIEANSLCPKCGSDDIGLRKTKRISGALSLLIGLPILFGWKKNICHACHHKW